MQIERLEARSARDVKSISVYLGVCREVRGAHSTQVLRAGEPLTSLWKKSEGEGVTRHNEKAMKSEVVMRDDIKSFRVWKLCP